MKIVYLATGLLVSVLVAVLSMVACGTDWEEAFPLDTSHAAYTDRRKELDFRVSEVKQGRQTAAEAGDWLHRQMGADPTMADHDRRQIGWLRRVFSNATDDRERCVLLVDGMARR